jgi:hypothetical protein
VHDVELAGLIPHPIAERADDFERLAQQDQNPLVAPRGACNAVLTCTRTTALGGHRENSPPKTIPASGTALPAVSRAATWGHSNDYTSAVEGSTVRKSCHGEMPAGKMACAFAKFMVLDLGEVMGSALITSCAARAFIWGFP